MKQRAFPGAISACAETSLGLGAAVLRPLISRVPPDSPAHPPAARLAFRLPGQLLPVAATVRRGSGSRCGPDRTAQPGVQRRSRPRAGSGGARAGGPAGSVLSVAPGNSGFRERAPSFLFTRRTREPEFRVPPPSSG
ncbi:hypothetical protein NN561_013957 [Cricetulus griseus]